MRSAYLKDLVRSVRGSLGRFLAIMGITALGCGFFAGLQMSGPDMRSAGDAFYDGTSLYDIRLVSTLGFSSDDVERIKSFEGVGAVMPAVTCDVMAKLGQSQLAVRMSSLDVEAASGSELVSRYAVASTDESYLNRLMLREGRWPTKAGECVITADKDYPPGFGVGDTVEVLYGTQDIDELLATRTYVVVGRVSASYYPYTGSFGSTSLGSGMISQYLYVAPQSFADDAPYTELYVQVPSALELVSGSDSYQAEVDSVKDRFEDEADSLAQARLDDVKADAQAELDERTEDYEREKADAQKELADAKAELDDAARELSDAQAELAEAASELIDAEAEIADGDRKLNESKSQLEDARKQLSDSKRTLDDGRVQLAESQRLLEDGEREWAEGKQSYDQGVRDLEAARVEADARIADGQAKLDQAAAELAEGEAQLGMTQADIDAAQAELAQREQEWAEQRAQLSQVDAGLSTCLGALEAVSSLAQVEEKPTQEQVDAIAAQVASGVEAARSLQGLASIDPGIGQLATQVEAMLSGVGAKLAGITIDEDTDPEEAVRQLHEVVPPAIGYVIGATSSAQSGVEGGIAQGDAAIQGARDQLAQAQEARNTLDAGYVALEEGRRELEAARAEADRQLAEAQAQLDAAEAKLASGRVELDVGRAEYEKGKADYERGLDQYLVGVAQYEDGLAQYRQGEAELEQGRAAYADGVVQYQEGLDKYLDGRRQYEEGLSEYESGLREANEKFSDAEAQLADAQRTIDELELPDIYALDRSQSEGAVTYNDDTLRMDNIANVFPFIFFLVAALVSLTTMTRMVDDERILIGTYKALGYSKGKIAAKYLAYAGVAGVVGATVGILVLSQVLPYIVIKSYGIIYAVPLHAFPLPISPGIALLSGGLGVGVTLFATWFAVESSLRETPATLMLPRAPKAGKRILLERITPIWSRLSFSWKVTCRNIFRYKRRLSMTVIGISGCTALLLTGFGLHDSIWDIIDNQYGPIIHYDTTIGLDDDAISLDADRVETFLVGQEGVSGVTRVQQENMQAGAPDYDGALMRIQVIIPRSSDEFARSVTLRNRLGNYDIAFDDDAVVVTEKLAMKLGLSVGDTVLVFDQDAVGNAVGEGHALTVSGVAENYVGNTIYVGRQAWKDVDDVPPVFQTLFANASPEGDVRETLSADLQEMDDVSTVIYSDETINLYRSMLKVVDLIVVVLIVSAAALAFIVLYNLTNINVSERVREIASLKVLGFTRGEVYAYIFREIMLLSVAGDALGMVLGTYLATFVITTAEVDYVMFGRSIHWPSYCYAFALTLVFTVLVILFMRRKLDHVNMAESLKSVD